MYVVFYSDTNCKKQKTIHNIIIEYYKHYNKSEFDAPEIHDVALKV